MRFFLWEGFFMKVAVIGAGHLGKIHARVYRQIPEVELVAVVDVDANRAKAVAESAKALTDYHELLGHVDAVSVASITDTHFAITRDFLEAGTHVLVEKPITRSPEEALHLVEIAHRKNLKLQVGHSERFNPIVVELFKTPWQPLYIEAKRMSPFRFRSGDVGVVLDLMVHDIDIVCALVQKKVQKVEAIGMHVIGKHEDMANARLTFEGGCVANITASRVAFTPSRSAKIFTTDAYMEIDYAKSEGKLYRKPLPTVWDNLNLQAGLPAEFAGMTFEDIFYGKLVKEETMPIVKQEPLYAEIQSFLGAIRQNTRPIVSGEDGYEVVRIAKLITDDIQKNLLSLPR